MPTYKNETNEGKWVKSMTGVTVALEPGETIETYFFHDHDALGLTLVSDAPYYNRVAARHVVEASAEGVAVPVSLGTARVLVERITGTISVYRQSQDNTPPELADRTADDLIAIIPAGGLYNQLVVVGTGTCDIVEYAE